MTGQAHLSNRNESFDPKSLTKENHSFSIGGLYQLVEVTEDIGHCVDLRIGALWCHMSSKVNKSGTVTSWVYPGDVIMPVVITPWITTPPRGALVDIFAITSRGTGWMLALRKDLIPIAFRKIG